MLRDCILKLFLAVNTIIKYKNTEWKIEMKTSV